MPRVANRIRAWRKRRALTLNVLGARVGASAGHLHKWETGKVPITLDRLADLAGALGCNLADLIDEAANVPVVGKVGAGAVVLGIAGGASGPSPRMAPCPAGLDPHRTEALAIEGDSMLPIEDGWLLFYSGNESGAPFEWLGRLCAVELAGDGPRYVARVAPGRGPGLYDLAIPHAQPLEGVTLAWAAPILLAKRPFAIEEM